MRMLSILTLATLFALTPAMKPLNAASRSDLWKQVDEAIQKGLPRTAITNLEPIIAGALKDKAYGEAAKAIARKIVLDGNIQGNKPEEKITRMETEVAGAPKEIVPLLRAVQANWYWHYFQQNRWRFMQRTATAAPPGKDFTTWDLPRLCAEIDKVFSQSLSASTQLKETPVATFDDLLTKGTVPDAYRPTLYDFVAQEALKFFTSGEQAAAKPEDAFEVSADSPMLGSVENFLAWNPLSRGRARESAARNEVPPSDEGSHVDTNSPVLKAILLYQELLRFHDKDKDPTAFIDVDLARLVYGHNVAFGENKAARYKAALKVFTDKWADHEVSALALSYWARVVQGEGDFVEARRLAQRGENAHRESVGGKMCHNVIADIEAKSASITTERVWNQPWPKISVRYRNVTRVNFRAVAYDWESFLERRRSRPERLNNAERKELLSRTPVLEWSASLPPTADFKERTEQLPAPEKLKPGFYFLVASHDPAFSEVNNQVSYADVWVSDLALVVRTRYGQIEGFVLQAASGEPVKGADVMAWHLDNNGNRVPAPKMASDDNGFFSFKPGQQHRGYLVRARANGQEIASQDEYWTYEPQDPNPTEQTVFFTDRALYRPGQTVQYKGICLRVDPAKDNYRVMAGRRLTVVFEDPNGKEVAKAQHQCNDYGSFSGSFTAPRDRVMGSYRIHVGHAEIGEARFNVEEYKRPKFQVTLEAPKTAPKLNDQVSLQGKAEAYTGAAVDGAKVKWRVVREVRWPYWWGWWSWRAPRVQGSQEIAHGTAVTGNDGTFKIEFTARLDPQVSEKDEASFSFSIHADVTDTAGETRSAQRGVNVGFTALQATLSANEWQTDDAAVELAVRTTTLDGEPQTAEGNVKVYRLKAPPQVQRPPLGGDRWRGDEDGDGKPDPDLSNPNQWELADVATEKGFTTDAEGNTKLQFKLSAGAYRAMLETQDRFGKKVTARLPIQVLRPTESKLAIKIPHLLAAPKWSLEPGQEFMAVWGTGYEEGRAFIEIEHRNQMIERFWTQPGRTQQQIKRAVTEAMRGGFTLHVTQVRENRAYLESRHIEVPWNNKDLELTWEHFTSKLQPAQKETWTVQIKTPKSETRKAEIAIAEMVAALYDESLDQYLRHGWMNRFGFFRSDYSSANANFMNRSKSFQYLQGSWPQGHVSVDLRYREFPRDLVQNFWGYGWVGGGRMRSLAARGAMALDATDKMEMAAMPATAPAPTAAMPKVAEALAEAEVGDASPARKRPQNVTPLPGRADADMGGGPSVDLSQVAARKNLNETAFFFPQLTSDSNGVVRMTFTMPEALTSWRFLGFAHDTQVRSGFLEGITVTAKDLMVQPNPPRFLREGDVLEFTVKVSNQSAARQEGKVRLTFTEALNDASADRLLNVIPLTPALSPSGGEGARRAGEGAKSGNTEIAFDIPSKESRSFSWRITVPDGCGFLTYKAVASTGRISDGEEGYLPVLSRRIFVTESLPLPIRGKQGGGEVVKKFEFTKLLQSAKSKTLVHQGFTVQMVSQPAWYAVMALPYLMEFPHECTEQTFNRLYANALARSIANSDPKIRRVFDQWKGTPALDSPLERNQDLKSVMIEETPWLRQAQNESQARRNVGILFDANRLDTETERTLRKLEEMQLGDGLWPWFPGGRGNDYITLYITTGFGRLRHLGVDMDVKAAIRSLNRLDEWMQEHYERIMSRPDPDKYVPSATDALYLYGRSFFLKDKPVAKNRETMLNFFLGQSRKHWLKTGNRQSQGHLAIALKRFNSFNPFNASNDTTPTDILKSLKERSVTNEEMGMFWRDLELSWWWYRAPIETQALMIEAFDEVMGDKQAVEDLRVWLLKQKQTQDWKTTKATADAIYGLLLRGRNLLASDKLVEVTVGGMNVLKLAAQPNPRAETPGPRPQIEPGTGFYEVRIPPNEIKPRLGEITVKKVDEGVSWGSVHWQYLEDMTKVTPYEGTPLKLKKALYTKVNTSRGPELQPVNGALAVGDELVVRIEIRVDRDMEYCHLKDQRGSGTEPVNVLSRYKYQDGLAYYESTRDTASHFFIDYLSKGTYVFEYSTRVQHRGQYQTGMASIQCMYAPEFNSHSESIPLTVK